MPEKLTSTHRRRLKLLWAVGSLAILILSLLPAEMTVPVPLLTDKVGHFLAYAAVTWVGAMAASTTRRRLYLGLVMLTLGIVLEFAQAYVPGRTLEMLDGAANMLGVMAGLGLAHRLRRL